MTFMAILILILGSSLVFTAWVSGWWSSRFSFCWRILLAAFIVFGLVRSMFLPEFIAGDGGIIMGFAVSLLLIFDSPLLWFQRWQLRDELAAEQLANDGQIEDAIA